MLKIILTLVFLSLIIVTANVVINNQQMRHSRDRILCTNNMGKIAVKIFDYIKSNNDIPKNDSGEFSLDPLQFEADQDKSCTLSKDGKSGYVVNSAIRLNDISSEPYNSNAVAMIAHDLNHLHGYYQNQTVVMFSDGGCRTLSLDSKTELEQYEKWLEEFQEGQSESLTYRQILVFLGKDTSDYDQIEEEVKKGLEEFEKRHPHDSSLNDAQESNVRVNVKMRPQAI